MNWADLSVLLLLLLSQIKTSNGQKMTVTRPDKKLSCGHTADGQTLILLLRHHIEKTELKVRLNKNWLHCIIVRWRTFQPPWHRCGRTENQLLYNRGCLTWDNFMFMFYFTSQQTHPNWDIVTATMGQAGSWDNLPSALTVSTEA